MTRDIWEETAPNAGSPPFVGATGGATDPRDGLVYFAGGYRLSADDLAVSAADSGKTELGMFSGGARKMRRSRRTRLMKKQRHQKKRQQTRRRPSRR